MAGNKWSNQEVRVSLGEAGGGGGDLPLVGEIGGAPPTGQRCSAGQQGPSPSRAHNWWHYLSVPFPSSFHECTIALHYLSSLKNVRHWINIFSSTCVHLHAVGDIDVTSSDEWGDPLWLCHFATISNNSSQVMEMENIVPTFNVTFPTIQYLLSSVDIQLMFWPRQLQLQLLTLQWRGRTTIV